MNGHDLKDKLNKRFPKLIPDKIKMFLEFFRLFFEQFFIISLDFVSIFNNILFYKSFEFRLNILEYLNKKEEDENMKAIVKELTQPLYEIDFLTKILGEIRKLIERKSNLTQEDIDEFNKLRNKFENINNIDYEVKDTGREFLDKDIVNLLERRMNKKQSPDDISNIRTHINTLLKEFKENKIDKDELQNRKDKLMKEINKKFNDNERFFGKI